MVMVDFVFMTAPLFGVMTLSILNCVAPAEFTNATSDFICIVGEIQVLV